MPALSLHDDADALAERELRRRVRRSGALLLAGLSVLVVSGLFAPVLAYALILAACVLIGHGGNVFIRALMTEGRRLRRKSTGPRPS